MLQVGTAVVQVPKVDMQLVLGSEPNRVCDQHAARPAAHAVGSVHEVVEASCVSSVDGLHAGGVEAGDDHVTAHHAVARTAAILIERALLGVDIVPAIHVLVRVPHRLHGTVHRRQGWDLGRVLSRVPTLWQVVDNLHLPVRLLRGIRRGYGRLLHTPDLDGIQRALGACRALVVAIQRRAYAPRLLDCLRCEHFCEHQDREHECHTQTHGRNRF
mmetsp:Transcript_9091/g.27883  ORF Transcript_9091/g.27883 Transcript_9091/m.27883 type:complete len:215 (+) Transcript_9091:430-1074(+)